MDRSSRNRASIADPQGYRRSPDPDRRNERVNRASTGDRPMERYPCPSLAASPRRNINQEAHMRSQNSFLRVPAVNSGFERPHRASAGDVPINSNFRPAQAEPQNGQIRRFTVGGRLMGINLSFPVPKPSTTRGQGVRNSMSPQRSNLRTPVENSPRRRHNSGEADRINVRAQMSPPMRTQESCSRQTLDSPNENVHRAYFGDSAERRSDEASGEDLSNERFRSPKRRNVKRGLYKQSAANVELENLENIRRLSLQEPEISPEIVPFEKALTADAKEAKFLDIRDSEEYQDVDRRQLIHAFFNITDKSLSRKILKYGSFLYKCRHLFRKIIFCNFCGLFDPQSRQGYPSVIKKMIRKHEVDIKADDNALISIFYHYRDNMELKIQVGLAAMYLAAENKNFNMMKRLIRCGVPIDYLDESSGRCEPLKKVIETWKEEKAREEAKEFVKQAENEIYNLRVNYNLSDDKVPYDFWIKNKNELRSYVEDKEIRNSFAGSVTLETFPIYYLPLQIKFKAVLDQIPDTE